MEKMTFPASNNKAPYRGVASTEGRIHGFSGGGNKQYQKLFCPKVESQEIANFVNYPGDYTHKSGDQKIPYKSGEYRHESEDREIRFKVWRLPDCPGEVTAQ